MTYSTGHLTISIPIARADRQIAERFSQEQPTPEKSEQVYLNTLAVLVVHYYLEMLEIPTDLKSSYSWNPVGRLCANVADIHLPGMGHLECRSLRIEDTVCQVPPEVWHDRLGYIVVQLDGDFSQGTILGFVPTVCEKTLELDGLQSLDALLVRLFAFESIEQVLPPTSAEDPVVSSPQPQREMQALTRQPPKPNLTRLTQWFDNCFESGWQAIEELLGRSPACLDFRFRSPQTQEFSNSESAPLVRRAKSIDLGIQLSGYSIVLLVELKRIEGERVEVRLQVHPADGRLNLPPHLQFIVQDRASQTRLQTQSRQADRYIQLRILGESGDRFSATLSLNDISRTEEFAI